MNTAIFKAARNAQLPGKYFPYGASQTLGGEEYRKILMRKNAFLASMQVARIHGITEEAIGMETEWKWKRRPETS